MIGESRNILTKQAALEVLLFHYGEPISTKKIINLLGVKAEEFEEILKIFEDALKENPGRGLTILKKEDKIQLATKPEFKNLIQSLMTEEFKEELSPAALETLSIVSYLGPITRPMIDYVRGVNSSFTVRNLLMRGLIDRDLSEERGNLYSYKISFEFLHHMGISRREELPEYEKYKDILERFEVSPAT